MPKVGLVQPQVQVQVGEEWLQESHSSRCISRPTHQLFGNYIFNRDRPQAAPVLVKVFFEV